MKKELMVDTKLVWQDLKRYSNQLKGLSDRFEKDLKDKNLGDLKQRCENFEVVAGRVRKLIKLLPKT